MCEVNRALFSRVSIRQMHKREKLDVCEFSELDGHSSVGEALEKAIWVRLKSNVESRRVVILSAGSHLLVTQMSEAFWCEGLFE